MFIETYYVLGTFPLLRPLQTFLEHLMCAGTSTQTFTDQQL